MITIVTRSVTPIDSVPPRSLFAVACVEVVAIGTAVDVVVPSADALVVGAGNVVDVVESRSLRWAPQAVRQMAKTTAATFLMGSLLSQVLLTRM